MPSDSDFELTNFPRPRGNRGEWAELYVFYYLLGEGQIGVSDSIDAKPEAKLNITRIYRDNKSYEIGPTSVSIRGIANNWNGPSIERKRFQRASQAIMKTIQSTNGAQGAFEMEKDIYIFMAESYVDTISAPNVQSDDLPTVPGGKVDIVMQIEDPHTSQIFDAGYSIKYKGAASPTLFNTSQASKITYLITKDGRPLSDTEQASLNLIIDSGQRGRIQNMVKKALESGCQLTIVDDSNFLLEGQSIFKRNLDLISSDMYQVLGEYVLAYYSTGINNISQLKDILVDNGSVFAENRTRDQKDRLYSVRMKDFLIASFAGLTASREWDGTATVNGGLITVNNEGNFSVFPTNNLERFRNYLFSNSKFDTPSSTRHGTSKIFQKDGSTYLNLNFQIRLNM